MWGTVIVDMLFEEGFSRPRVPGLICWYVVHVWALVGLARGRATAAVGSC